MSSNGLAASRWANGHNNSVASAPTRVGLLGSRWANTNGAPVRPRPVRVAAAAAITATTTTTTTTTTTHGRAASRWVNFAISNGCASTAGEDKVVEEEKEEEEDEEEDDGSITPSSIKNSFVRALIDELSPSELRKHDDNPRLLFSWTPLHPTISFEIVSRICQISQPKYVDQILVDELTAYVNSFSGEAINIMYDQLVTWVERACEDQDEEGIPYDGKFGRESQLWMERLRMRDLNMEFVGMGYTD